MKYVLELMNWSIFNKKFLSYSKFKWLNNNNKWWHNNNPFNNSQWAAANKVPLSNKVFFSISSINATKMLIYPMGHGEKGGWTDLRGGGHKSNAFNNSQWAANNKGPLSIKVIFAGSWVWNRRSSSCSQLFGDKLNSSAFLGEMSSNKVRYHG